MSTATSAATPPVAPTPPVSPVSPVAPPAARGSRRTAGEDGTITVLTLGLLTVAVALVVTVVDVSAVFLARRDLAGTCDAAAVAAAQEVSRAELYGGDPTRLPLDLSAAARAAATLAQAAGARVVTRRAGGGVSVSCERDVDLPLARVAGLGPVTVLASADAQAPLR